MKKTVTAAALLCLAASLTAPAHAADPCEMVMCMWGKVTGNSGGDDCKGPEKAFFDKVKKKKGKFSPSETADARKEMLMGCKGADPLSIAEIISKFGRMN
ncbi:conjugal transfer protein [Pantoea ananatis]|uniref:conjugal transfer protein n=1 Tax=Pantoea ananas TaxID=553 RepID=UPI001B3029CC|nr:conjugal transfer protein [Pantoea ananatis]